MKKALDLLPLARVLALVAGGMDFATGVGMVLWPTLTLSLMLVPGAEALIYARFVGVFVGAVGASYLLAWLSGQQEQLRGVLRFTLPFRLGAGSYCAVAVAVGWLSPMWLSVTAVDFGLVAAQIWLLGKWR